MSKFFWSLLICSLCSYSANAVMFNQNEWESQQQQNQLSILQKKINQVKNTLTSKQQQQQELIDELKKSELVINQQLQYQRETKQILQQQQQLQQKLKQQQQHLQTRYQTQRQQLSLQLRLAYLIDDPSFIRLLLNKQTFGDNRRMMTYLRYVYTNQQQQLDALTKTIAQLHTNQQQLQEVIKTIEIAQNEQKQQYRILQQAQFHREELLTQINQEIGQKKSQLTSLEIDRRNLEQILQHLQKQQPSFTNHPFGFAGHTFGTLKGKLPLPTRGTIVEHFGSHSESDQSNLKGILIAAPTGQEVHAIYAGKVIFADWLKSFGLLLIIDHGDGFMSLYARNESIFKKLGDNVALNEVIAKVGQSGGHQKSGLYFEIRHNGHPKNPELWCNVHQNTNV